MISDRSIHDDDPGLLTEREWDHILTGLAGVLLAAILGLVGWAVWR